MSVVSRHASAGELAPLTEEQTAAVVGEPEPPERGVDFGGPERSLVAVEGGELIEIGGGRAWSLRKVRVGRHRREELVESEEGVAHLPQEGFLACREGLVGFAAPAKRHRVECLRGLAVLRRKMNRRRDPGRAAGTPHHDVAHRGHVLPRSVK